MTAAFRIIIPRDCFHQHTDTVAEDAVVKSVLLQTVQHLFT